MNGGRAEFHNAGGLVKGVPPFNGEVDDGDVCDADEEEDGAGLLGGVAVGDGGLESDEAEVKQQEDEFGGEARVPNPPRPHIGFPQMEPVARVTAAKEAPTGAAAAARTAAILTRQTSRTAPAPAMQT